MKRLKLFEVMFTAMIVLLISSVAICQNTPYFQMPIYFEDAVGNKDTVVAGFVLGSTNDDERPLTQYGEHKIEAPFDSVLDARIFFRDPNLDTAKSYFSKKIILPSIGSPPRLYSDYFRVFLHSRYPPVTISYDSSAVRDQQLYGSFFTRDEVIYSLPDISIVEDFMCVGSKSSFEFSFNDTMPFLTSPLRQEFEVQGTDTLLSVAGTFFGYSFDDFCDLASILQGYSATPIDLYPNPAHEWISLEEKVFQAGTSLSLSIYDISGKQHFHQKVDYHNLQRIDVSHLEAGSYFLLLDSRDKAYCGYFVKF